MTRPFFMDAIIAWFTRKPTKEQEGMNSAMAQVHEANTRLGEAAARLREVVDNTTDITVTRRCSTTHSRPM